MAAILSHFVKIIILTWNLAADSAALLPRHSVKFQNDLDFLWLWNVMRSGFKMSYNLNGGQSYSYQPIISTYTVQFNSNQNCLSHNNCI